MRKTVLTIATAASLAFATAGAFAAELKVYVSGAMAHALEEISQDFVKKNGHTLDFVVGTTGVLQDRVRKGEKADVIEVTSVGMDRSRREAGGSPHAHGAGRANIGVAVPRNAPAIDISTPEALKRGCLRRARSLYRSQVAARRCGDGEAVGRPRHHPAMANKTYTDDRRRIGAEMVAGEADIAVSFISEILPIKAPAGRAASAAGQNPSSYAARSDRERQSGRRARAACGERGAEALT